MKRQGKSLASFAEFVRRSPHVQRHARSLRLRTSPLDVRDELDQPVDAATVLGLLGILPRVTVLHLEDITLARTTPSTPLPPAPPLEHLTLSSCQGLKRASASCILQTLQHFHHISRLRLTHLYEECPWLARSAPVLAQLQLSVHTFELERTKFIGDTVLSFLAASAAGPATVRATLPTDVTTAPRLRRFVKALGPRLAHLEYSLRIRDVPCPTTLLLAGIDPTPADHVVGAALDLGAASGLRTLRLALSLARAKLIPDLVRTATPTLASCRALRGAPFALVLVAPLGEVLEELAFLEEDAREAFKRLEDVLVDLVGRERVERVVFELEVWPAVDDGEVGDKVGRAEELVRAIFPRLDASDGLRVVQNARTEAPRVNVFWGGRYDVPW
ncbi:hypothetical protein PsYK624_148860 [Phanerochaete sordida]|uniref:Uncharacterized protein n=1 Tax=Phanerochaete sordida TaxID=48140 RepID=A0A9P3LKL6_9APHY|nr:hypothetical protein PsYK624_148860 [Phanerochaete sordida]